MWSVRAPCAVPWSGLGPGGSGWATVYIPKSLDCSETCQFFVWYDTSGCRREVERLWSITSSVMAGKLIRFEPLLKDQSMVLSLE